MSNDDDGASYESLLELERVFLEHVKDEAIAADYTAARAGDEAARKRLQLLMLTNLPPTASRFGFDTLTDTPTDGRGRNRRTRPDGIIR